MQETLLHELLAVEKSLSNTANSIQTTTGKTLQSKETIFSGLVKSNEIFAEDKQFLKTATEIKEVQSTVGEQLDFMAKNITEYWDLILKKESANQQAKADIVVDGKTIAKDVPSIVLLSLEKKLNSIIDVYNNIPTLDSSKSWIVAEESQKSGVWKLQYPVERQQTQTVKNYIEASPATQHHKAQVVEDVKTEVIGKYIIQEYSGNLTSLEKASKLERLTKLLRAVNAARQRANCVVVNNELKIGKGLFDYINSGVINEQN